MSSGCGGSPPMTCGIPKSRASTALARSSGGPPAGGRGVAGGAGASGLAVAPGPLARATGPFAPADPEPLEVGEDRLLPARNAPSRVRVVDPQEHRAAALVGEAAAGDCAERVTHAK